MSVIGLPKLKEYMVDNDIEAADVKLCDLAGKWRHLTLSVESLLKASEIGIGADASNYGLGSVTRSDASLSFDGSRPFLDPFVPRPTVSIIGQLAGNDGQILPGDPRGVAQRAEGFLKSTGLADASLWLPELEFYVYQEKRLALNSYEVACQVVPMGEIASIDSTVAGTGYHAAPPSDHLYPLRAEATALLEAAGYPVKYHHHEVGVAGQVEIELGTMPLVQAADAVLTAKYLIRNVAHRVGLTASFLPKPLHGLPGNGMHVHISFEGASGNASKSNPDYSDLSVMSLQFIGGILSHGDALCAFTNPSTNSYRRLGAGHEAPSAKTFGAQNRNAAIRIPAYTTGTFEYRPMDATVNPYLSLAALLMAGLDGVEKSIDPQAAGFGDGGTEASRTAANGSLPASLDEALDALEKDHAFLLKGGVFTEGLISSWIALKRRECRLLHTWPHPWEHKVYGDI